MHASHDEPLSPAISRQLLQIQHTEITEHHVYRRIAASLPPGENRRILENIAEDEAAHAQLWAGYTGRELQPRRIIAWTYYYLGRLLGITFAIKLMERGETKAEQVYRNLRGIIPEAERIASEEDSHEQALIGMLDEERLQYTGSMVLGLNDALVELTGALAGFTLALQNTRIIAMTGLITGVAAALSMAASSYLQTRAEEGHRKNPLKASTYTGVAYLFTVALLIAPYLALKNYYVCLACTLAIAVAIIAAFNYYICVARDLSFRHRFLEMTTLSFGVAGFSFLLGFLMRKLLGVEP
jgi:VIT1/CCC1 family predicted Fe2+/Mn2+ transporter